jgi:hypothetical protein
MVITAPDKDNAWHPDNTNTLRRAKWRAASAAVMDPGLFTESFAAHSGAHA